MCARKFIPVLLVLLATLFCQTLQAQALPKKFKPSKATQEKTINNQDSVIFDLASATLTPTYIEFPVHLKSDDVVNSFDYAFRFNLTKLTFTTTTELLPEPSIISLAYFNPSDLYLRYTTSALVPYPVNGTQITTIRFNLASTCLPISKNDFTNTISIINGVQCPNRFTTLDFSIFVPTAGFKTGPTCSNAPALFTNTTTITNGSITLNSWSFSNGNTSSLPNTSTSFTVPGTASASLIVKAANGCSDTTSGNFNINIPPVPSFNYTFDCVQDSVLFTNTSTISIGSVSSARWFFDNPNDSSNAFNPVYHFDGYGPYAITMFAISNFSCFASVTNTIILANKVAASFTLNTKSFCIGSVISFSDVSTYSLGTIGSWKWDFGDGSSSTQQNPSYTYTTTGNYSITLTALGTDGCNGKYTVPVIISGPPTVSFSSSSGTVCSGAIISFSNQSTAPANSTYFWYFGDGNTSSSQSPAYTYTTAGNFPVKLIVTTPPGCVDSLTSAASTSVFSSPNTAFNVGSACVQTNIVFTNLTSIASGSVVSYAWQFGDGDVSTSLSPSHTYTSAGTYTILLEATSDIGCKISKSKVIFATVKPNVAFAYSNFVDCLGDFLTFNNQSSTSGDATFGWEFGDGGKSNDQNPSYRYISNGYYPIKLVVTNPGGCADSITKPYIVTLPASVEAVISETIISNGVVSFSNQSQNAVRSDWDFGDGQNSNKNSITHTFPTVGVYTVCLTAYNSLNCVNQICKEIFVGMSRILGIPSAFTPNNDGSNDIFKVRGGPFTKMELRVYNEWGNLLFMSEDQSQGWDGTFNGEYQPTGAYEYFFKGSTPDNKTYNRYGIINLIR
jgi:gliding motility-associated-like protein